jgi:hypothetical protein
MDFSKVVTAKYSVLLAQAKEVKEAALADVRAAETKLKVEHKVSELNIQIAEATSELQTAVGLYPLDIDAVVRAQKNIALLELQKKNLADLVTALF